MALLQKIDDNISGIYKITNIVNNKFYIGSSINVKKRLKQHLSALVKNNHYNSILTRAYNKYGDDNFKFELLFKCEPVREDLLFWEQLCLNNLECHYNLSRVAGSMLGYKHSDTTRAKVSMANRGRKRTPEVCKRLSETHLGEKNYMYGKRGELSPNYNKKHSAESVRRGALARSGEKHYMFGKNLSLDVRSKISASTSGINNPMYGRSHSEDTKAILSRQKSVPIERVDPITGEVVEYANSRLTRADGFCPSSVSRCCRGEYSKHKNFWWKYANETI